jgi:thioredoxin-like negative regulator of GroEL
MAAPEVHELAREMAGRGSVLNVNTEEHPGLAAQFKVQPPYFLLMRGGMIIRERAGVVLRAEMRRSVTPAA